MTGEEMKRAVAFILEQQAQITSTMEQVTSTMARLTERVDRNAEGITALLAVAEMHEREIADNREAQARADERQRHADERQRQADERQRQADERLRQIDERLNALIHTVERYISEGRNGKA